MSSENPKQARVVSALTWVLRPMVKLLIQHQITFPFFSNLVKRIYVDVASRDIPHIDGKVTDSRLSLLTGVHRKDIRKFREETDILDNPGKKAISLSAQVVSTWTSDSEYSDKRGRPKPLWRLEAEGHPSFESLVDYVSRQDIRARPLLDEWLRLGIVSLDEYEMVHLEVEALGPAEGFEEKLFFFEKSLHDHLSASVDNLLDVAPPHLDRCIYYNNLKAESIDSLKQVAEQESMKTIKQLNRKAREMQKRDSGKEDAHHRFDYGAFFYSVSTQKDNKSENDE